MNGMPDMQMKVAINAISSVGLAVLASDTRELLFCNETFAQLTEIEHRQGSDLSALVAAVEKDLILRFSGNDKFARSKHFPARCANTKTNNISKG